MLQERAALAPLGAADQQRLDQHLTSVRDLERAIALAPGEPRVLDTLGVARLKTGDAGRAVPILRRAARSSINGPAAKLHLAEALYRNGEGAEAKTLLREVLAAERARASVQRTGSGGAKQGAA